MARTEKSPFAIHMGEALIKIAGTYPTLLDVVVECIQNALDANATKIWVILNRKSRLLTIRDNGEGRSRTEFEEALTSVCSSIKPKGKLGRFGIGLISPLGKCESYAFTSTTRDDPRGYLEWEFITDDLQQQAMIDGIPMRKRSDLVFEFTPRPHQEQIFWRTEIRIERFSKDSHINKISIETLKDAILDRFKPALGRLGTIISVRLKDIDGKTELTRDIKAEQFSGKKLEEAIFHDKDAGDCIFHLFLARRTEKGRKGKVLIGEADDEYRIPFTIFARSAEKWLDKEIIEIFLSGVFEGEILASRISLLPSRKGFVENEKLAGFCATLETWHKEHGKNLFEEAKEEKQEERYQKLGRLSLQVLESMLFREEFSALLEVINSFKLGTVGEGHALPKSSNVKGMLETPALAVDGARLKASDNGNKERRVRKETEHDKPGHHPLRALGPRGKLVTLVRSDSLGLYLFPDAMDSEKPWELDVSTGVLRVNVRHPGWVQCEQNDRVLTHYMAFVAVQALVFHSLPEEWRISDLSRLVLEEMVQPYSYVLRHTGDFFLPKPQKKKV